MCCVCVCDIYIYIQVADPFETLKRSAPGWGNILSKSTKTKSSNNQYHWAMISWHLRWHDSSRPGETSQIDYVTWQKTTGSFGQNDSGVHALGQNQKTWKNELHCESLALKLPLFLSLVWCFDVHWYFCCFCLWVCCIFDIVSSLPFLHCVEIGAFADAVVVIWWCRWYRFFLIVTLVACSCSCSSSCSCCSGCYRRCWCHWC